MRVGLKLQALRGCSAHNETIVTALELVRQVRQDERFGVEDELDELMS